MKNSKIFTFTLLAIMVFLCPFKIDAKESITCVYPYNNKEIIFKVTDKNVELPWKDGSELEGKVWYYGNRLSEQFLSAAKSNNGMVCPTLSVEENGNFNVVMVNPIASDKCNGTCQSVNAKENNVVKTVIGSSVGIYNKTSYVIPYFRQLMDKSIEWSIDGENYVSIKKSISYDKKNELQVEESFAKTIFTNNTEKINIYRCISKNNGKYNYLLSENKNSCPKNDLSEKDGQAYESVSYNGAQGAVCKDTFLGDPEVEDSPAWLLRHLFLYVKVLGPMIVLVMSAIDFTKAIVAGDDETMQKCYKKLIKRLVLAIALFVLPSLVEVLLDTFGITGEAICVLE
ncbi:MAG: hypothetical protein IJ193_06320 [Bacilli bacterium]|nr:hypothetical protein [Bacilli bacterium]